MKRILNEPRKIINIVENEDGFNANTVNGIAPVENEIFIGADANNKLLYIYKLGKFYVFSFDPAIRHALNYDCETLATLTTNISINNEYTEVPSDE